MNFDTAFSRLIGHEGQYAYDANDPGGESKFGITRRSYPGEDIRNMPITRAKYLYQRDFWGPAGCDALPDPLKYAMFDFAVNSGVKPAIRLLQSVLGVPVDGILGPHTLQAVGTMDARRLAARLFGERLEMLTALPTWASFGKGWARRIALELKQL